MVGRELAALLGLAVAASPGGENDRAGVDHLLAADGPPAGRRRLERPGGWLGECPTRPSSNHTAQALRDRIPRAVAALQQTFSRRPPALGEPIATVLSRKLDAELLEPVDRSRCLPGQ